MIEKLKETKDTRRSDYKSPTEIKEKHNGDYQLFKRIEVEWGDHWSTKGITLVALVVTIIVLLILAGIAINLAVGNNGLFSRTKNVAEKWSEISNNEVQSIKKLDNEIKKESQNVVESIIEEDANKLNVGDYIIYDSGVNGKILCRILYDANSDYGLQIITNKNVKNLTLGSTTYEDALSSYNTAITKLNDEAMKYLNTKYAADARCVGSNPIDKTIEDDLPKDDIEYKEQTTNSGAKGGDRNSRPDYEQMQSIGISKSDSEYWLASRYFATHLDNNDGYYHDYFYLRCIKENGELGYQIFFRIRSKTTISRSWGTTTRGLRICFKLKSDNLKITGGNGTAENPYKIDIN